MHVCIDWCVYICVSAAADARMIEVVKDAALLSRLRDTHA